MSRATVETGAQGDSTARVSTQSSGLDAAVAAAGDFNTSAQSYVEQLDKRIADGKTVIERIGAEANDAIKRINAARDDALAAIRNAEPGADARRKAENPSSDSTTTRKEPVPTID